MKRVLSVLAIGLGLGLQADVNLISDKSDFHINWLVDDFKKQTGINVNVLLTEKGLVERAKVESDAVVLTNDALNIIKLKDSNVLKPIDTKTELFHTDKYIITSGRIRGFFVEKGNNIPYTYDDIVSEKFNATVCIRPLTHNYNLVMFAQMYETKGEAYTRNFINKLRTNLATAPSGNDREQVKLISEGICEVSIGNSYYMGLMQNDKVQSEWASKVNFVIPEDEVWLYSAVGMTKDTTDNRKFIEYISSPTVQDKISKNDYEYTHIKKVYVDLDAIAKHKEKVYNIVTEN